MWHGASAPSPRLPSGRLRPSEPAIGPAEGGTRWTGYGEGRGEGAFPQAQTRGDAPSPGISAKDALIPTSPRKRGEVKAVTYAIAMHLQGRVGRRKPPALSLWK